MRNFSRGFYFRKVDRAKFAIFKLDMPFEMVTSSMKCIISSIRFDLISIFLRNLKELQSNMLKLFM